MTENDLLDQKIIEADAAAGERTLDAVYNFIGRFVAHPSEAARVAHALWIAHTYLMDRWETTPRLAFLSAEKESGKTRAMEATEVLVPNPLLLVSGSSSFLFRVIGGQEGVTVLFDEIDTVFSKPKENEETRAMLNAGYRRGAVAGRCVGKNHDPERLPAYAPVALAGIGWLPDTILSRSIIIRMRRRHAGEHVEEFRRRLIADDAASVRSKLETWALSVPEQVTWPNDLPAEIRDRAAEIWEPLFVVADNAGGMWPVRARKAAVELLKASTETEPSLGVRLLADLHIVFGNAGAMSSKDILARLHCLEEAPWAGLKGKPLDERGLARKLKQYGIRSKTIRFGDITAKGYDRTDLHDAWGRYLPSTPPSSETSVTRDTQSQINGHAVTHVASVTRCAHCGAAETSENRLVEADVGDGPQAIHRNCIPMLAAASR